MLALAKKSKWTLAVALLAIGLISSTWAWLLIATPVITVSSASVEKHVGHFGLAYFHVFGGTVMLFLGLANLYVGTTRRFFRYHKLIGRLYLIGGGLSTIKELVSAPLRG